MKRLFRLVAVLVIMMIVLLSWGRGPEGWQRILSVMVFAAVVLAPQLLKLLSRKRQTAPAGKSLPESDAVTSSEVMAGARRDDAGDEAAVPPQFVPSPAPRVQRRPSVEPVAPVRVARRHSRHALLGSKRSVQDAVVVATILGRCRAMDPHHPD